MTSGGVLVLGNFDGVHRGHQAVLEAALVQARILDAPLRVVTFEPHPRRLFRPKDPPFRLTPARDKERLLKAFGVDEVIALAFTRAFSEMTAEDFVSDVLITQLNAQHIVAGYDFTFGYKRGGDMARLREWLMPHKVGVSEVQPLCDEDGLLLSSSRIRDAIQGGDLNTAQRILGRVWSISGIINHGAQRGRTIGFPTANMGLGDVLRPVFGVYAVKARQVGTSDFHAGVANIGKRPTVDGINETLEFHLFDFAADIYGQEWEVELHDFIRPEQAFPDLAALKAQIATDAAAAKSMLA